MKQKILSITDHSRDAAGLTYVYPVVSRRAGGVSVGINLNPNRACNWRCVYCQVPGLVRGRAPQIDVPKLEAELQEFLGERLQGDYFIRCVPEGARRLADIAISGDGEPTTARQFAAVVEAIARVRQAHALPADLPLRLITNGSQLGQASVREAIGRLGEIGGEIWFKLDGGTTEAIARVNNAKMTPQSAARRLRMCASLCPTWVQTCLFATDGVGPDDDEINAYVALLQAAGIESLRGVLLYGLARPSQQPEAPRLSALSAEEMERIAQRIREKGLTVRVSP